MKQPISIASFGADFHSEDMGMSVFNTGKSPLDLSIRNAMSLNGNANDRMTQESLGGSPASEGVNGQIQADTPKTLGDRPILLFDGVCNLCHGTVQFVLRHEQSDEIHFCSLQSETGRKLLRQSDLPDDYTESLVFLEKGRVWLQSDAALALATYLKVPWKWVAVLRVLPRRFRDLVYRWVARSRYRWFGKRELACAIPKPGQARRMLDHGESLDRERGP